MSQPAVGRIVHYVSQVTPTGGPECLAAMITYVWTEPTFDQETGQPSPHSWISVTVFPPDGSCFGRNVRQGEPGELGTWHWPERV